MTPTAASLRGSFLSARSVRHPRNESENMDVLLPYLLVGLGGFVGAIARFEIGRLASAIVDTPFPLGTFVINISGSFLLGILGTMVATRVHPGSEALRLALGIGFLGAFTTFSTFEMETHGLLENGSWIVAASYVTASLLLGLLAVRAGIVVTKALLA
jgi:CrcB protein